MDESIEADESTSSDDNMDEETDSLPDEPGGRTTLLATRNLFLLGRAVPMGPVRVTTTNLGSVVSDGVIGRRIRDLSLSPA